MRTWVHRVTIKTIVDLHRTSPNPREVADAVYECIAAFRYFEAIELWLAGDIPKALNIVAKVRLDKFTDTTILLSLQARIGTTFRQQDPFTDTCVAAHQQRIDWQRLTEGCSDEQLARIKARHEHYRLCQPENQPKEEAA